MTTADAFSVPSSSFRISCQRTCRRSFSAKVLLALQICPFPHACGCNFCLSVNLAIWVFVVVFYALVIHYKAWDTFLNKRHCTEAKM